MKHEPQAKPTPAKPAKTDCIASCGWGWGVDREPATAMLNMLRHVPMNSLEDFQRQKKKLEVTIFEASEDWTVYDTGSVQATYVAEYGTAKLDPALCLKLKDAYSDLQESVDYTEE